MIDRHPRRSEVSRESLKSLRPRILTEQKPHLLYYRYVTDVAPSFDALTIHRGLSARALG